MVHYRVRYERQNQNDSNLTFVRVMHVLTCYLIYLIYSTCYLIYLIYSTCNLVCFQIAHAMIRWLFKVVLLIDLLMHFVH